jgi:hypothetical protein
MFGFSYVSPHVSRDSCCYVVPYARDVISGHGCDGRDAELLLSPEYKMEHWLHYRRQSNSCPLSTKPWMNKHGYQYN